MFIPPILREEILSVKPTVGSHVLVYQTSKSQKNLITTLATMPQVNFCVYGFNKERKIGNVHFCKFSETSFIRDLGSCSAVITNGGFSLISECVYLHKPVMSVPIVSQFEQFVNASWIDKLGYGRYFDTITSDNIKTFLFDLSIFKNNLSRYQQNGNDDLFKVLDREIAKLSKEPRSNMM